MVFHFARQVVFAALTIAILFTTARSTAQRVSLSAAAAAEVALENRLTKLETMVGAIATQIEKGNDWRLWETVGVALLTGDRAMQMRRRRKRAAPVEDEDDEA